MVQGVGFRFFTQRSAARHQVWGYVRNLEDGRVEAVAQGDERIGQSVYGRFDRRTDLRQS